MNVIRLNWSSLFKSYALRSYKITKLEYPLNPYLMSSNVCKIPGGGLQCRLSLSNSQNDIKLILGKLLIVNVKINKSRGNKNKK